MTELNEKAKKVFQLKYAKNKTRTWKETCRNIADFMSLGEIPYMDLKEERDLPPVVSDNFYEELVNLRMIPGGRIIANANTGIRNLANCFVLPVDDSRQSIYGALKDASEVFAMGGGVGYSFSKIREEGALIKSTNGKASGPLSFLTLFDQTGEVIQQASRRGAQLASLHISHPDIEKFIGFKSSLNSRNKRLMEEYDRNLKAVNGNLSGTKYERVLEKTLLDDQLTHFNISVLLTDEFMQAVEKDLDWNLISPSTNEIIRTVKAKDLLYKMAKQAWESGDPGELFYDRINKDNLVYYIGNITSTNPCGEVPLLEGESCILTSINLYSFYNKETKIIDFDALKKTIKVATRFLEDVTEITEAPVEYINTITKNLRRLGLGVMGLADLLVALNIPYESEEAVKLSEYLSWFISYHAWITSYELAKERGAFGYYNKDKVNLDVVFKTLYANPYHTFEVPFKELKEIGLRNVSVTSLAPTGSIAIIGGVNSGIEPFFALAYKRNITEGVGNIATDSMFEINPALENKLKEFGYSDKDILEIVDCSVRTGSLQNCNVTDELKLLFKTANEISWQYHIKIQAAWQKYTSNAISKTINIPEESTVEDIFNIYLEMWKADLKGGTIYRDRSKVFQILERPKDRNEQQD